MTALPTMMRDRLTKLIPRLASDAEGEICATVRAIRSALAAHGLDLHDLAAAVGGDTPGARGAARPAQLQPTPSWAELSYQERLAWMRVICAAELGDLDERVRIDELHAQLKVGVHFSPHWRRVRLFDEHVARLFAKGARP